MGSYLELPLFMYSTARSAHYALQYDVLQALEGALSGRKRPVRIGRDVEALVRKELMSLLKRDATQIAQKLYPVSVLRPESPVRHFTRLPKIMADGLAIFSRRKRGRTTEFTKSAREQLEELPRYYRRNFHFQTDGYLSEHSASLYEHQVEMLFRGSADAMRRLILPPLKKHFKKSQGRGLRILEIGAGTGRTTRFVQLAFPQARLVATDLSQAYLKQARKKLVDTERVDFLQADGAHLPFSDGQFDAVYSVFLFHELPMAARRAILAEAKRVLKPGGFFGFVDSIQKGEKTEFDPLLELFPVQYHEPFYRDYYNHPMEKLIGAAGFKRIKSDRGFFSKFVAATR
jgi:ubiquinone/menaquinone biosynthesis C-methylase UbiE